ncbi:MAG TPA: HDIG domain-containing protein [Herpetosiphonaceae bacterium]
MSNRQPWRYVDGFRRHARLQRWLLRWLPPRVVRPWRTAAGRRAARQRKPLITMALFGLALGVVLGVILATPISATAGIVKGAPSPVTLHAPRSLSYESEVMTRRAQEEAANNPANVQVRSDSTVQQAQRDAMSQALDDISRIRNSTELSSEARAESLRSLPSVPISDTLALQLVELDDERWQIITDEARRVYDEIWQNHNSALRSTDIQAIRERELPYVQVAPTLNASERNLVLYFVNVFLKANRMVDQEATELRRAAARKAVEPVTVTVIKGQNIVREGDVVSEETYETLLRFGLVFGAGGTVAMLQQFVLGLLAAWLFATYLYRYQSHLWLNHRGLTVIGAAMAALVLGGRIVVPIWEGAPYAFPLATLAVLLTVLFNGSLGLLSALTVAPLIGMQTEQSIGLTLTLMLGSAAGVFVAQRAVRSVSFVWVGLSVAFVTMLSAGVFWLGPLSDWPGALDIAFFSLLNGAQSVIIVLGTYHILGRLANVVTPLQLMELAHPNHPLLHRLMREAPGTYHHSIVVSNLAEVAAENIGADPLLARVGAYYHDVGKILRPYFFTDNQHERSNVHDVLDPKTSATIIIDHVREGARLAREHGLPQQVVDFIPQHHGTNLVSYFYQRALQEDGDTNIEEFRYPGPKPQTREAGIMMLADGVEATVRARAQSGKLRPARPNDEDERGQRGMQSIAEVVEQIVSERLRSGQLDECPLTLRDIAVIKESFINTLQGIYHPRVDYPQPAAQTSNGNGPG